MDADGIIANIRKILRSVNLESKRIQKEYGLSIPQVLALSYLSKTEMGRATHKELTNFLSLNNSTTTGIVSRLEAKGFVVRQASKEDKRISYITLTAIGQNTLQSIPNLMHQQLSEKLSSMPADKLAALENAFETVVTFMGIDHMKAAPVITQDEL